METQKIALFGASTHIGQRILNEALNRGHNITVFIPGTQKFNTEHENLTVESWDVSNNIDVINNLKGHDVVISTYEVKSEPQDHLNATLSLIEAIRTTGIKRLIALGYPGSSKVEPMLPFPTTTEEWKAIAETQTEVLGALENEKDIRWSYIHYPEIHNSVKKNNKPVIGDQMLVLSSEGKYWFHSEKCAENILNEAEYFLEEHREY